jgi:hypothetical protein
MLGAGDSTMNTRGTVSVPMDISQPITAMTSATREKLRMLQSYKTEDLTESGYQGSKVSAGL